MPSARVGDGHAEKLFRQEDAFRTMTKRAVPEIGDDLLAAVEPRVDRKVVLGGAIPFASRGDRVVIAVCYRVHLRTHVGDSSNRRIAR